MNCSASFPGPRGDRNGFDESTAQPPSRPPQLRAVLALIVVAVLLLGGLTIVGAFFAQWWRSA